MGLWIKYACMTTLIFLTGDRKDLTDLYVCYSFVSLQTYFLYLFPPTFRMDDGRLLDYLMNHDELMEEKVAFYIRDIMEALQYLHNCRVAHLDIKVMRNSCPCRKVTKSNLPVVILEGCQF